MQLEIKDVLWFTGIVDIFATITWQFVQLFY